MAHKKEVHRVGRTDAKPEGNGERGAKPGAGGGDGGRQNALE